MNDENIAQDILDKIFDGPNIKRAEDVWAVYLAAKRLYLGEIGFNNPNHPEILSLGKALFPKEREHK